MDQDMLQGIFLGTWYELKEYIDNIFNQVKIEPYQCLEICNLQMNLLKSHKSHGYKLYHSIVSYLVLHCKEIIKEANDFKDENLLKFYHIKWRLFKSSSLQLDFICGLLNAIWIKPEYEKQNFFERDVYVIRQQALIIWKQRVFDSLCRKLTKCILVLIRKEREGGVIDRTLVHMVLQSYIELGLKDERNLIMARSLHIYKTAFEEDFLRESRYFYDYQRLLHLKDNSDRSVFEEKMKERELEEIKRVNSYLSKESLISLLDILKDVMK